MYTVSMSTMLSVDMQRSHTDLLPVVVLFTMLLLITNVDSQAPKAPEAPKAPAAPKYEPKPEV